MNAFNKVKQWQVPTQISKDDSPAPFPYMTTLMLAYLYSPDLLCFRRPALLQCFCVKAVMELDRFQALLQQRAILCWAPLNWRWIRAGGIREPNTANINEISPYGWHTNSHYGAHGSQPPLCSPVMQLQDLKSLRQRAASPDEASSPPNGTQSLLSRQHTTSNGHHRDEWIFCLVCPQCGLLRRPRILTLSECFTGTLARSWHKTTRGLAWSTNTGAAEGWSGGEMLPEKILKNMVKMMHKRVSEQCKQDMRLAGSLPTRIGLLVLTRTMHTHRKKRNTGDIWGQRWRLEWLNASKRCTVTWAHTQSPPATFAGTRLFARLLSTSFCRAVSGKRGAVAQIDDNFLLTSADVQQSCGRSRKTAAKVWPLGKSAFASYCFWNIKGELCESACKCL